MFCAAAHEYVGTERISRLLVKQAIALEHGECVGIEYLGPFVAVISCRVSSGKYVC